MLHIGICDDSKSTCAELEEMLAVYARNQRISTEIQVWYTGEALCRFLGERHGLLDILFLDIDLNP